MLRLLKLRPLLSASLWSPSPATAAVLPPPPPYLLLPRFPVSGTPKGKARLKNIANLKKSSFQKNKKPSSLDSISGNPHLRTKTRRSLPLRLNAVLRRREAVRQALGLHSRLLRRDLDLQRSRQDPPASAPPLSGLRGLDLADLGYVSAVPAFDLTVEDGRALAGGYSRLLMHWHRLRQKAEGEALELMREAVEAMPEDLRRKAIVPVVRKKRKVKEAATGKAGPKAVMSGKKLASSAGKKGGGKGGKK